MGGHKDRKNHRIAPGHYEYRIDGHVYTIKRISYGVLAGKEDVAWRVTLNEEEINVLDLLSDAIEYVDGMHKQAREEHFGYRMLPE